MRIIKFTELCTIPWKNGGGITREIAAYRKGENIIWRLSMADVESDGPFSMFPGLTRILTVIQGKRITLKMPHIVIEAAYGVPVSFDGGLSTDSKLIDGPIRDLNVMYDRQRVHADVQVAQSRQSISYCAHKSRTIAVIGLGGQTIVNPQQHLGFGDTALIEGGKIEIELGEASTALIVTLDMLD